MARTLPPTHLTATLLTSLALMACNQQGTAPPPAGDVNALVLGQVQSPYFDALKPNLKVVEYTGSQKVDDYDVVVFDGDDQSPQGLKANPLVEQALRDGKWVLGLDVTESQKQTGFGDRLGAVNQGTSPGWMVRMGSDANGRSEVRIVHAARAPLRATPGGVPVDPAEQLGASTSAYANTVLSQLRGPGVPLLRLADNPVPPNLIMATYYLTTSTTTPVNKTHTTTGKQTATAQYNYTFKIFLDNSNNPLGDFQWVSVEADVTANPTNGTGQFANDQIGEKAWFQDRLTLAITPSAADNSLFTSVGSSPATANNVTTVTTGTSFTVGLSKDGPSGSYTYEKTHSLQDWKVDNNSAGNFLSWNYRSSTPIDADGSYQWPSTNLFTDYFATPKAPNPISKTQLQLSTQGVWKTTSVLDRNVGFIMDGRHGLVDAYCPGVLRATNECRDVVGSDPGFVLANLFNNDGLKIDLGSVVPIPIASVTFSPGASVKGGTAVTGTVTLSKPAKINTVIGLSSNSPNATVLNSVTGVPVRWGAAW